MFIFIYSTISDHKITFDKTYKFHLQNKHTVTLSDRFYTIILILDL